ncbi:hypothetical protein GC173_15860 [bacterium]|nr:hypothetical protein [bacterium]
MSFFQPDEDLPQHPFIPRKLLREEPWGEIWHVLHRSSATTMILIAWCTADGDALFEEIEGGIRRWMEVAGTTNCPHLLRIVELSASAIPYVLVEDPGGLSLRDEVMGRRTEPPKPEAIGKLGMHLCQTVLEAEAYDCAPLLLTPDSIYICTSDRDNPFKVLPICPRAHANGPLIAGGRYQPPEFKLSKSPTKLHADIYAIPWLLTEVWRRDFDSPLPKDIAEVVPLKGLSYLLDGTTKLVQGVYSEPNVAVQGFERWLKKQMATDIEAHKQAEIERKRGPLLNFIVKKRGLIIGLFVFLLVAGGTGYGVYYFLTNRPKPKVNVAALVKTEANDVATMYLQVIQDKNAAGAADVTMGTDLVDQTGAILKQLATMKQAGVGGEVTKVTKQMAGSGDQRFVEARLADDDGRPFAILVFEMSQRSNFEWIVVTAFLKPLNFAS